MTHKYLSQIRTIPSYHEDQSNLAKTWRKAKYTFKSASSIIIKNKKTRIITSVLAIYMILTSGFVVAFVNVDSNNASAQSILPASSLEIKIKKQRVEADNVTLTLEVKNKTNQTIASPVFQFQSSFDNIVWKQASDSAGNKAKSQSSGFELSNIGPSQKITYSVYGKLTNPSINNIAITSNVSYNSGNQIQKMSSPKFLIDLK